MIFRTKLQHFLRLFWTSQNRNSVIFELALGPLLVPAPLPTKIVWFSSRDKRNELYGKCKLLKGGESSSQFQWFTIAKIEL